MLITSLNFISLLMALSRHPFLVGMSILCFFVVSAFSASRQAYITENTRVGFRVELKRINSWSNLTSLEHVQRALLQGRNRLQRLTAMVLSQKPGPLDMGAPVHVGDGEFFMSLAIGTPPKSFSAILDTGSDLIWTQCEPCTRCFHQHTPIFEPMNSSSFSNLSCSSELCQQLPTSYCYNDLCQYTYQYGDQSFTDGTMASETFTFGSVSVPNISFGCGVDNAGIGFSHGAGLVGLGRGPLSLVSQLDEPKFSYCLASINGTKSSSLLMGSMASNLSAITDRQSIIRTPLVQNSFQPSFYYIALKGISVGRTRLPINETDFAISDDGSGGMVLDSGTTITYLVESAYETVKAEFISQTNLSPVNDSSSGLDLCFELPPLAHYQPPKLVFHFDNADLSLPSANYFIKDLSANEMCLALGPSVGMSIFGNIQQQNFLVIHDLESETVSFIPTVCGSL